MKKLKEIARLLLECNLGVRPIARACNISTSTASLYAEKFKELGATYKEVCETDEDSLSELIFPKGEKVSTKTMPDFAYLARELKKKGVTLQLLHEEYKKDNPHGYEKSQFYQLYHDWKKKADPVMRFTHKAGEKMFVDFSGDKAHYQDSATGKIIEVELFVSVLGASSYIFARAVPDQTTESFIDCNIKAFEFYGGCSECLIPDNLKSGVTHACYYDPEINKTLAAMAEHYNIAVIPTRIAKPKDKAKVENAVLQAQRRILAALRNRTFFSLAELNEAIAEETKKLNMRPMAVIDKSRYDLFVEIEKPLLKPLPEERFVIASWKKAKVHIDYHVSVEKAYYSVPYTLIGESVDIMYTGSVIEIYHKGKRVASHMRAHKPGAFVTENLHMPTEHRQYLEWTPARIRAWGEKIGLFAKTLMEKIMEHKTHPEQGFRSCLGIIRLSKTYSPERVENACKRALEIGAYNYRSIKSLLERGLENTVSTDENSKIIIFHSNIRGNNYYRETIHD
ncbi:MAG: Integrase core domain protein [Deltaproteobacteria bacterium ADurb.Bin135]|nr:MAG: Integrase core domain protein [Deltaproteobacteria bacterium ADurb.Bin135]